MLQETLHFAMRTMHAGACIAALLFGGCSRGSEDSKHASPADEEGAVAQVTGRDFLGEAFGVQDMLDPYTLTMSRFGGVTSDIKIPKVANNIKIRIGTSDSEQKPFVSVSTQPLPSGRRMPILTGHKLEGDDTVTTNINLSAGDYRVIVEYGASTAKGARPPVYIRKIAFF